MDAQEYKMKCSVSTPITASLGTITRLSRSGVARPLPSLNGKAGCTSYYMRDDVNTLQLTAKDGVVGDDRLSPSHIGRDRDILLCSTAMLRELGELRSNGTLVDESYLQDSSTLTVGQNVTVSDAALAEWCVGDVILLGCTATVRLTSCRRPCPKNNHVHGAGAEKQMLQRALGGIFGTVLTDGPVCVGDCVSLVHRPSPSWTCVGVHLALYGPHPCRDEKLLLQIAALPHLEAPRYRDVALNRAKRVSVSHNKVLQSKVLAGLLPFFVVLLYYACWIVTWPSLSKGEEPNSTG